MSHLPFTLQYEIERLRSQLKQIDEKISDLPKCPQGILDFSRAKYKRERVRVEADLRVIEDMLDPDPTPPDHGPGGYIA